MDLENIEVRGGHSRLSLFFCLFLFCFVFFFCIVKIIVDLYAINKGNKGDTKKFPSYLTTTRGDSLPKLRGQVRRRW